VHFLKSVKPEDVNLRAAAMTCTRGIAKAVGANVFSKHFKLTMGAQRPFLILILLCLQ
jgi:hypothetical protein